MKLVCGKCPNMALYNDDSFVIQTGKSTVIGEITNVIKTHQESDKKTHTLFYVITDEQWEAGP